jgi:hypothetical protein
LTALPRCFAAAPLLLPIPQACLGVVCCLLCMQQSLLCRYLCISVTHLPYISTLLFCAAGLSWSDVLLGPLPNVYLYAANNPSESIIAKRRGYGTIVSHNVPPYGRAGTTIVCNGLVYMPRPACVVFVMHGRAAAALNLAVITSAHAAHTLRMDTA